MNDLRQWIHDDCQQDCLALTGNKIRAVNKYVNVLSKLVLGSKWKFTVKLDNVENYVQIGIADISNSKATIQMQNNIYIDSDGFVWRNQLQLSRYHSLESGTQITVQGDFDKQVIVFSQNQTVICTVSTASLQSKQLKIVPFMYLNTGSEISILQCFHDIDMIAVHLAEKVFHWDSDLLREINYIASMEYIVLDENANFL